MLFTKTKRSLNKMLFIIQLFYIRFYAVNIYFFVLPLVVDMQLLAVIAQMCCTYTSTCIYGEKNEQVIIIIITTMVSLSHSSLTLMGRIFHGLCVLFWSLPPQEGTTPLFIASQKGYLPVVQTLLQHGAKVDLARDVSQCSFTLYNSNLLQVMYTYA